MYDSGCLESYLDGSWSRGGFSLPPRLLFFLLVFFVVDFPE